MSWKPLTQDDKLPAPPAGCEFIDSHCHLDMREFSEDRGEVLARAAAAGVTRMVTIGAGGPLDCNEEAVRLAEENLRIFATVGVHPHDAQCVDDKVFDRIERLSHHPRVVGIGETGLDFHYDHSPRNEQCTAFRRFLGLARQRRLPVVVHLRAADQQALEIARDENAGEIGGVIHCFSSGPDTARAFLDLGFHLSFSGIVSFKSADDVRAAARLTPSDRLLIETDAPFLAPIPFRGRRNEPALVSRTAAVLAEIRAEPIEHLARATTENAMRLFRLV